MQASRSMDIRLRVGNPFLCFAICFFLWGHLFGQGGGAVAEDHTSEYARKWQIGALLQGGFVPRYVFHLGFVYTNEDLDFYCLGLEAGRQTRRFEHVGLLDGRGEALVEIQPLWIARYPPQTDEGYYYVGSRKVLIPLSSFSKTIYGGGVTPLMLRWNFDRSDAVRQVPWLQLGGGILWTNGDLPLGNTSELNFVPQAAAGVNLFKRPNRSVDLAFKFIHISNAGLGDTNPAIHDSLNFSLGYSWWK